MRLLFFLFNRGCLMAMAKNGDGVSYTITRV